MMDTVAPMTQAWRHLVASAPAGVGVCAVIGHPVAQSVSPAMHSAGYEALGLNFTFGKVEVVPQDLFEAVSSIRSLGIRGVSVTVPHKTAVMELLDEIDPVAREIGAVNTIVNTGGRLKGYNTDWTGAMLAVEEVTSIAGKSVVVIGAGGAAKAVCYCLRDRNAEQVSILNRTEARAKALADQFGMASGGLDQMAQVLGKADILIQTTKSGMNPNNEETVVPREALNSDLLVMDIVFKPMQTRLLREAQDAGCRTIPGYRMLLLQGVRQFELYTGVSQAPVEVMERALLDSLKPRE